MTANILTLIGICMSIGFPILVYVDYKRALNGKKSVLFERERED